MENEYTVFSPMETCFELYGLDFMVEMMDAHTPRVHILEVNPGPDFKQTGNKLKKLIENLLSHTCDIVIKKDYVPCSYDSTAVGLVQVYDKQWSVSKLQAGFVLK